MRIRHIEGALFARLSNAREDLAAIVSRAERESADFLGKEIKAVAGVLDEAASAVEDAAPDTLPTGLTPEAFAAQTARCG